MNSALTFDVGRPRFQAYDVLLMKLQFRRVFDGDNALAVGNVRRKRVEKGRLTGAGTAGDQYVQAGFDGSSQQFQHRRGHGVVANQIVSHEPIMSETADGQAGSIHGQRRDDRVDTGTVREPGVHHRRRFIDATADRGNDAIDDGHQVSVVAELNVGGLEYSAALDVYALIGVHQDIRNRGIGEQRLEWTQAKYFVQDLHRKAFPFLQVHGSHF